MRRRFLQKVFAHCPCNPALQILHTRPDVHKVAGVFIVMVKDQIYFFGDTTVNIDPTAEDLAEIALLAGKTVRTYFDTEPRIAMLSFSTAGCNVECKFCQNWELSQFRPEQVQAYDLPPAALIAATASWAGSSAIRTVGNSAASRCSAKAARMASAETITAEVRDWLGTADEGDECIILLDDYGGSCAT